MNTPLQGVRKQDGGIQMWMPFPNKCSSPGFRTGLVSLSLCLSCLIMGFILYKGNLVWLTYLNGM